MRQSGLPDRSPRLRVAFGWALLSVVAVSAVQAQKPPVSTSIYTCLDDNGRRLTSDRPIPECTAREQKILNRDGSVKGVHPPTLTAEERAVQEARDRKANAERMAALEIVRRDKNLLSRYPDEASHRKAREAALDTVRLAMKATEARLKELATERRPLLNEAEFYLGKPLPSKLKASIDANDTATEAQRAAAANQQAELDRVNLIYDTELARLQRLWAGAQPGSMGPLVPQARPPSPLAAASAPASTGSGR